VPVFRGVDDPSVAIPTRASKVPSRKELREKAEQLFKAARALEGDGAQRLALLFEAMQYEQAADAMEGEGDDDKD
jgi:hypothetical protein